jgi:arylsulfatase A-like enzyme
MPIPRRVWLLLAPLALLLPALACAADTPPNLILILCDDLGYADLACYGNTKIKTPNLDRLANEGIRFTDFYAAGAQCTPSRAGLLTGRYPVRFGLTYSLMTDAGTGIPATETLLPQVLKTAGYSTMLAGKWHLGDRPEYHPLRHGFDHFAGLLRGHDTQPLEFWQDDRVTDPHPDPSTLTARYTAAAVDFIRAQSERKKPFFLMLAHTAPHTPLAPGRAFAGKSAAGPYGDCVEEIDDSVGQLLAALKQAGTDQNTLIFFTSDNGPALDQGKDGGSAGPFRAGKFSTFEGGLRIPAIAWLPPRIPPRTESHPAILLDLFPTFISLAGGKLPARRPIDGKDLSPTLLHNQPRDGDEFFFYYNDQLQAARQGPWKLKLPDNPNDHTTPPMLFDLPNDPSESTNLAPTHPDLIQQLRARITDTDKALKSP